MRKEDRMLLTKFAVQNFRGFKERICLDLSRVSNYAFNTHILVDTTGGNVLKNGIIYGPNGSGKSNLSLAIFDIENHLSQRMKKDDYYNNFATLGSESEPVVFEYNLQDSKYTIRYTYSKDDSGKLLGEKLTVNGVDIFFWESGYMEFNPEFHISPATVDRLRESNMNRASMINYLVATFPLAEGHYLLRIQDFVDRMLWFKGLDRREFIGLESKVTYIEEDIIESGKVEDFAQFLYEVSGQRFEFCEPQNGDKLLLCKINDKSATFNEIASTGTMDLELLYFWLNRLERASFVFIDEFDAFYHYDLAYRVCERLFRQGCQVFLSSHNTYLMTNDLLRPDAFFIIDGKQIKPICECTAKELRLGHNLEKLYRGGAFDSVGEISREPKVSDSNDTLYL